MLVGIATGPAAAITPVRRALMERHATVEQARAIRRVQAQLEVALRQRIAVMEDLATIPTVPRPRANDHRSAIVDANAMLLAFAHAQLRSLHPWAHARLRALRAHYADVQGWLDREAIFRVCPVPGYVTIYDNFGDIVRLPHVPVHVHQGNDIEAPAGSPIIAPFDGYASTSRSTLGGIEVRVSGADGYVYNAHVAQLGQLGSVSAGDTVGYVGVTGDATGPHDHLEWHPGGGPAQDPNELLVAACVDAPR